MKKNNRLSTQFRYLCSFRIFSGVILFVFLFLINLSGKSQVAIIDDINKANRELWYKFIDKYGIIHDFVGETPTPEDCELGKPNAVGWWSPIENGPFFTGLYLIAACERASRSGNKADIDKARLLAQGLMKCASVSDVKGFIARGVGTDGKCHYPLGSVDQTIPWYLGLYNYLMSDIPTDEDRQTVMDKLKEVSTSLKSLDWKLPCDGNFKGEFRGDLKSNNYLEVTSFLFVLRMMYELFKETVWLEEYKAALYECPRKSVEQLSDSEKPRIDICAAGYRIDSLVFHSAQFDKGALWIYVKNQATLTYLVDMENDEKIKSIYQQAVQKNAANALEVIGEYEKFDNNDDKVFGHANWREGYPHWFQQKTQKDAEKLSGMGDKDKLGQRKSYERTYMTNPLAAASIIAMAGDPKNNELIKKVISHYDYSKLNMAEFFYAEVAYYALPIK